VIRYSPSDRSEWDEFVDESRNGTFLFRRDYMEYHSDRFVDFSLMIYVDGRLAGLMPANRDKDSVISHAGLTYGGLVLGEWATAERVVAMVGAVLERLRDDGVRSCTYKTVPSIYHRTPAEEDRYALFRAGAQIVRRDVLTVLSPTSPWGLSAGRRKSLCRARRLPGVEVGLSQNWAEFWEVLRKRLDERHGASPVHRLEEMLSLAAKFPNSIRLLAASVNGEIAAGAVLYESAQVVRTQYLATNANARKHGLLDLVLQSAIEGARRSSKWFDFGASTVDEGTCINAGLAFYKESFGGRAVVHDFYRVELR
jgi:hypothetical protein